MSQSERVVVIGGAGFIGKRLTALLAEAGCHVVVVSRSSGARRSNDPRIEYQAGAVADKARMLELVAGASVVYGHRDLPRRRASGAQRRKVTGRTGGRVARSGAISARHLCLQSEDARSPVASRSGAQGRLRPGHRKRRGSSAVRARENRYEEQRTVRGQGRPYEVFG